ncbi:hypothetical protein Anapl_09308 [Anas platyrhynchos]|uniref:Uncharacterized protein n=1 Tax=Anas platyrhynchos TaxID=8839 RepID=R0M1P9_ANAPL|nr:hypothetical protein Anapl_09308 [Anas platyrhynchos]
MPPRSVGLPDTVQDDKVVAMRKMIQTFQVEEQTFFAVKMEQVSPCLLNRQSICSGQWCAEDSKLGNHTLALARFNSLKIIEFIIIINLGRVQVPWEDLFGKSKLPVTPVEIRLPEGFTVPVTA